MRTVLHCSLLVLALATFSGCGVSEVSQQQLRKKLTDTERLLALTQQDHETLKNRVELDVVRNQQLQKELANAERQTTEQVQALIVLLRKKQEELDALLPHPAANNQRALPDYILNTDHLAIPLDAAHPGYKFIYATNRSMRVLWRGCPVWQTTNMDYSVDVSPDGRSAVWSLEYFPNNKRLPKDEFTDRYYQVWSARDGNIPVPLPPPRQSRGIKFGHPYDRWLGCGNFHWDSTGAYLYFCTSAGTELRWWQMKPGTREVRYVDSGGDFWLFPQLKGADHVLIQGLRYEAPPNGVKDYANCYLYTPEDIAKPIFKESHVQRKPSPTWN